MSHTQPLTGDIDDSLHSDEELDVLPHSDGSGLHAIQIEDGSIATKSNEAQPKTWRERVCRYMPLLLLVSILLIVIILMAVPPADSSRDPQCLQGITEPTQLKGTPRPNEETPPDTIIAYVGDVALPHASPDTQALYQLIKSEGAQALVIQGDLDYVDCPYAFEESLKTYFGSSFPVFTTIGNHDQPHYPEYSAVIAERLTNAHIDTCVGEAGRQAVCTFKGIVLVLTTPGIFESGSDATHVGDTVIAPYINATLLENRSPWLVCSWHKNQAKMQTGGKIDETGWGVYDTCRERGAMIATGHEHSYARTYLMSDFAHQTIAPAPDSSSSSGGDVLHLSPGSTFAFVNGLGGKSVRPDLECQPDSKCPWFASKANSGTGIKAGALFCKYHVRNDPNLADCYFKSIDSTIIDAFTLNVTAMPR